MGRKISILDENIRRWYTPDIDNNLEDPEPFRVLISPISGKVMRQLKSTLTLKATKLEQDELMRAAEEREEELKNLIVSRHVHDVENFSAVDVNTREVTEIKTGEQLTECIKTAPASEYLVLVDIYEAIVQFSTLNEDTKKKPNSQSSSLCPTTQGGSLGGVVDVAAAASRTKITSESSAIATGQPQVGGSVFSGHQN